VDRNRVLVEQGRVCAVCGVKPPTQVDHDHETGVVRGILCLYCNTPMGAFGGDPQLIKAAIEHLKIAKATK
jgi:hypothetical protein